MDLGDKRIIVTKELQLTYRTELGAESRHEKAFASLGEEFDSCLEVFTQLQME
jgi:hypothetical protein